GRTPAYFEVRAAAVNGALDLRKKDRVKFSVSGKIPEFVKAQGFLDLPTNKYELNVSAQKLPFEKWANYTLPLPGFRAVGGTADVSLRVSPPKTSNWAAALVGRLTFYAAAADFQNYKLNGIAGDLFIDDENLALKNLTGRLNGVPLALNGRLHEGLLSVEVVSQPLYKGRLAGHLELNLAQGPQLKLKADFSRFDLAALAQNTPGIEGKADGTLELTGSVDDLAGKLAAQLSPGLVFGQQMDNVSASFKIKNRVFWLDNFTATSGNAAFRASGKVTPDLTFDLAAEAFGLRLAGQSVFGKMGAVLNKFKGRTAWKLDKDFLAQPLKNLTASGEVSLSDGRIGEQQFDEASGGLSIGNGRIEVADALIKKNRSLVRLGGVTGVGTPTKLLIAGNKIDLADVKLLNFFLPAEARNPTGSASFEIEVTGELSKETRFNSFDPLLDLTVDGHLQIVSTEVDNILISDALLRFFWHERSLKLSDSRINLPNSRISLDFVYGRDGSLTGSLAGTANLGAYQSLTSRYGKISGLAGLAISLSGSLESPQIAATFWLSKFGFNEIYFDDISGSLSYRENKISVLKPIIFKNGSDRFSLAGDLAVDPDRPEESVLGLDFKILQADLASSYRLLYKIQGEITRRFFASKQAQPFSAINLAAFKLPDPSAFDGEDKFQLYLGDSKKPYYLAAWKNVWQQAKKTQAAAPEESMGGTMTAEVTLAGKVSDLTGRLSGRLSRGFFRDYHFDLFDTRVSLKDQDIKIEKADLKKDSGSISARGDYNLKGGLRLSLVANSLPLDIMKIAFPGKEFKGAFNMNAGLDGPLQNLRVALTAEAKNISMAGIDIDEAVITATKKDDHIYLNELSLLQGDLLSTASGSVLLSHPGLISLEADLKGNTVGLMNLFTDQVKWKNGDSNLSAKVTGTLDDPKIDGTISVRNGTIYIKALESDLRNLSGTAEIESNIMTISALTGTWTGKRTNDIPNPVGLAGSLDLSNALAEKGSIDLNLIFSPTRVYAFFPNLYVGVLDIKELSLQGPLSFDLSDAPLLKGKVGVNNAVVTISQPSGGGQPFPLRLALEIDLSKNVYAVMGDIATLNLSNILMNLEINGGLNISGNLASPDLLGKIAIKRGTVNIFNQEFSLLTSEMRKKYSTYGSAIAEENTAAFKGEGAMPDIDVTASIDVDNQEKDASGKYVKKTVNILAHLRGTIGVKEEERGLKISLSGFLEDKTKSPSEFMPAAYSEQDLKVMLLPDFIKSLAGVNQPGGTGQAVETNAVIADYLSSRVQSLLFRSLEREAEQRLGLESLTLAYNLGPKIGEAMGVKDIKGLDQAKPAWSVGFVKGFFDRLYINVRYAQGSDQAANTTTTVSQTIFNYELTYKLTPIWSIIYYREPSSLSQPTTGYQKITLAAGFSLW
ncbi:MAG: translocation/assembly module TamB domain-containing protein, partial [Candidatus Margulisbacteria bacterium]|nr:translocation/assembly module TamB domain-containing protein [Candidatus Margulisiibacteriota bacterium]